MESPTFLDVLDAKRILRDYLKPTPLISYPALDKFTDSNIFVKREDLQPISSFKIRGGINLIAHLEQHQITRGFVTASTGNHGQSIAYASKLFSTSCVIVVPHGANPLKVEAIENLGAEVIFSGEAIEESQKQALKIAHERNMNYVHPANERFLIAGVATETLEILGSVPDLDFLFVPVGAGSTAAGASLVVENINPRVKIIGVQSIQAPAAQRSWSTNNIVSVPTATTAEGLATSEGYELPQKLFENSMHDFILVDDAELNSAVRLFVEKCHVLSELAGAAALAGVISYRKHLQNKKVAIILSGSNITVNQLQKALLV
ncbi:threonine/serine dehydratase [SAR202 cluster bacterium AD-802-E10_MRT_200m]|nr:threonine/serine dehydratase [SAR202 cluster bacterium AD-802-E10_MRT_200m]